MTDEDKKIVAEYMGWKMVSVSHFECESCNVTCPSSNDCRRCKTVQVFKWRKFPSIPDKPLSNKEKIKRHVEKKNWKAIQDKHSRR